MAPGRGVATLEVAIMGNVGRRASAARIEAPGRSRRMPPIEAGYQHFRLERQGALLAPNTLLYYDRMVLPFLVWLDGQGVQRFEELDAGAVRTYRAGLAARPGMHGRPLAPKTLLESHRAILCFLRWARREGYDIDARILDLVPPRVPQKEPTVYHVAQVRKVLAACNPAVPTEELVVRLLVGSGIRRAELCGLAAVGPDGLPDVMTDSMRRGRVELRVRWDAGAKGRKSRRIPITPRLAAAIKRYEARHRRDTDLPHLLINEHGTPYEGSGIKSMMDRLQQRTGFHVHAHAFRHTFATVATKLGWNFEHLRAAMGHSEYGMLQRSEDVIPVVGALRDQDVIRRSDGAVAGIPTGERRWSTPELLSVEERLVASALARQDDAVAVVPSELLQESLRAGLECRPGLGDDQVAMAAGLATSGAGVQCVEAAAGTGKTTALGLYLAACRRAGFPVVGCAPSARARDELRLGAGIDRCETVDRLLLDLDRSGLEQGSVVILDEASMAGSRKLGRLLDHAAAARAKVVLVGDTRQLSAVDAGGGFRGLVARLGAHQLLENRCQVEPWEREALRDLREGRVQPAMATYAVHGRLHLGDREELIEHMVDDWWAARPGGEAVMQASTWRDVAELNERARERLVAAGLVEQDGLDVRGVTIGVGDQVIVLRNDRALGVINGTVGTVTAARPDRGSLALRTTEPKPRLVCLPASFLNGSGRRRVALAHCRTIHKAQGATYRGELHAGRRRHDPSGGGARGIEPGHAGEQPLLRRQAPIHEDHDIAEAVAEPAIEGLVAAAGRSRAQVMAVDLMDGPTPADAVRERRRGWARRAPADAVAHGERDAARRAASSRPPPRIAR